MYRGGGIFRERLDNLLCRSGMFRDNEMEDTSTEDENDEQKNRLIAPISESVSVRWLQKLSNYRDENCSKWKSE
jgi:hypothetical protein